MKRRNALKLLGTLVICLGGYSVNAQDEQMVKSVNSVTDAELDLELFEDYKFEDNQLQEPLDYIFESEQIRNLVIKVKDKKDIVIPFSDIIKSLS